MATLEPPAKAARLIVVDEDDTSAGDEFSTAIESVGETYVVFLRNGQPHALSETAELPAPAGEGIDAVRERAQGLARTMVDLPDSATQVEVFYAPQGAVVMGEEGPALIPAIEPLRVEMDVRSLFDSPDMLTVAADTKLPGPGIEPVVPKERRRCPGPRPHWVAVPPGNPVCPVHRLNLDAG